MCLIMPYYVNLLVVMCSASLKMNLKLNVLHLVVVWHPLVHHINIIFISLLSSQQFLCNIFFRTDFDIKFPFLLLLLFLKGI